METTLAGLQEASRIARRVTELRALLADDNQIEASSVQAGPTFVTATKDVILAAVQAELDTEIAGLAAMGITLDDETPEPDPEQPPE